MIKSRIQEINAGSMADIAFLLLIFFLVTTTLSTDIGITRKLPPIKPDVDPIDVHDREILVVLVNSNNEIMVEGESVSAAELKELTKEFVQNKEHLSTLPTVEKRLFPLIGTYDVTPKHVISLQNHRETSYNTYVTVQNELTSAYNELKEELAQEKWGVKYLDLSTAQQEAVNSIFPVRISEAEPVKRLASAE